MARSLPDGRTLGLAFLGCGSITRRHARLIGKTWPEVARFYASRDAARAEACLSELSGVASFGSYREAIEDERVDAVVVATPTVSHLELTLAALAAGKDVIVEKPPFMRSADFERVEAAERSSGRRVFVGENYFYRPLVRRLREVITRGDIGEVRYLVVKALKAQDTGGWRDDAAIAGGGALFEGGIHWVNLMGGIGLTVESAHGYRPGLTPRMSPRSEATGTRTQGYPRPAAADDMPFASAPVASLRGDISAERSMLVVFRYAEGAVGTLFHAWDTPSLLKGLRLSRIYGTEGSIAFESNGLFLAVFGKRPRIIFPGFRDISGYRAMFADYLACIRSGREPHMTLARARRDLELVEAAYRSIPFSGD
ncbi:MAG TPA: Gfo/Idh/MocA family oxidoreductase [Gemmatimonadales bacterium]|nr:Gfo/Idh/MocA family oxidoreductase [Gemmatimonadales bacterium]